MDPQEYDEIIRHLVRVAAYQDTLNERLTASIERLDTSLERIDRTLERIDRTLAHVEITQARIETLLARMIRPAGNGQDT